MQNRYSLIVTALGSREGTQDSPFPISASSRRAFCRMQDKKNALISYVSLPLVLRVNLPQLFTSELNYFVLGLLEWSLSESKWAVTKSHKDKVFHILLLHMSTPQHLCTFQHANQFVCFLALTLMPQGIN